MTDKPTLPEGWVTLTITHEGQHPEEVAYGPQIMMDRLGKWLAKYFDFVVAAKTQPSPTAQPAPQQEAQEPCPTCAALARTVMLDQVSFDRKPDCYGIRQITDDEGVEEWEDIRTSPDVAREEANDMMATGRGELYEVVPLWTTPQPSPTPQADSVQEDAALQLIADLVRHIDRETCTHEETHRGGAIWEICNSCGSKWADDKGGKPEFKWPDCVEKARAFLDAARKQGENHGR